MLLISTTVYWPTWRCGRSKPVLCDTSSTDFLPFPVQWYPSVFSALRSRRDPVSACWIRVKRRGVYDSPGGEREVVHPALQQEWHHRTLNPQSYTAYWLKHSLCSPTSLNELLSQDSDTQVSKVTYSLWILIWKRISLKGYKERYCEEFLTVI